MDQQPTSMPTPSTAPTTAPSGNYGPGLPPMMPSTGKGNKNLLLWALIGILGLGAVGFGLMSVIAFNQAHVATTTLNQQKAAAVAAAREDQKKQDQQAAEIAAESPYRSYIAPIEYGSFQIKFPQNWSATVDHERSANTQVTLVVHPDFVQRENSVDQLAAAKILLVQRTLNEYLKQFDGQKTLVRKDVTVSGVKGVQVSGKFSDKRTSRVVVVPIRDKSLVFINEDTTYNSEFDQILAQSKALP